MKTTLKFGIAVAIIVAAGLSSCGKYEEGPKLSLASKNSRMVNTWKLVKYMQNGVDQNISGYTEVMELKKDNSYTATITIGSLSATGTGTWAFSSDKTSLITTPTGSSTSTTSTILRLKSNELWTKEVNGSNTDESHYESN